MAGMYVFYQFYQIITSEFGIAGIHGKERHLVKNNIENMIWSVWFVHEFEYVKSMSGG